MAHTHIYIIGLLAMLNHRGNLRAELSGAEQYFTDSRQGREGGFSLAHRTQSADTGLTEGPSQSTIAEEKGDKVIDVERQGAAF
jgi:hypothetical protein